MTINCTVPQSAYNHLFNQRHIINKLPSGITGYMALCVSGKGWRICDLKTGDVYTRESYKRKIGHYPPLPHDGEMIAPYPVYANQLYREFLLVRKSYKKFLKQREQEESKGFGTKKPRA